MTKTVLASISLFITALVQGASPSLEKGASVLGAPGDQPFDLSDVLNEHIKAGKIKDSSKIRSVTFCHCDTQMYQQSLSIDSTTGTGPNTAWANESVVVNENAALDPNANCPLDPTTPQTCVSLDLLANDYITKLQYEYQTDNHELGVSHLVFTTSKGQTKQFGRKTGQGQIQTDSFSEKSQLIGFSGSAKNGYVTQLGVINLVPSTSDPKEDNKKAEPSVKIQKAEQAYGFESSDAQIDVSAILETKLAEKVIGTTTRIKKVSLSMCGDKFYQMSLQIDTTDGSAWADKVKFDVPEAINTAATCPAAPGILRRLTSNAQTQVGLDLAPNDFITSLEFEYHENDAQKGISYMKLITNKAVEKVFGTLSGNGKVRKEDFTKTEQWIGFFGTSKDDFISSLGVIKLMINPSATNPLPSDGEVSVSQSEKSNLGFYVMLAIIGLIVYFAMEQYQKMKNKQRKEQDPAPFQDFHEMCTTFDTITGQPRFQDFDKEFKTSKRAQHAIAIRNRRQQSKLNKSLSENKEIAFKAKNEAKIKTEQEQIAKTAKLINDSKMLERVRLINGTQALNRSEYEVYVNWLGRVATLANLQHNDLLKEKKALEYKISLENKNKEEKKYELQKRFQEMQGLDQDEMPQKPPSFKQRMTYIAVGKQSEVMLKKVYEEVIEPPVKFTGSQIAMLKNFISAPDKIGFFTNYSEDKMNFLRELPEIAQSEVLDLADLSSSDFKKWLSEMTHEQLKAVAGVAEMKPKSIEKLAQEDLLDQLLDKNPKHIQEVLETLKLRKEEEMLRKEEALKEFMNSHHGHNHQAEERNRLLGQSQHKMFEQSQLLDLNDRDNEDENKLIK